MLYVIPVFEREAQVARRYLYVLHPRHAAEARHADIAARLAQHHLVARRCHLVENHSGDARRVWHVLRCESAVAIHQRGGAVCHLVSVYHENYRHRDNRRHLGGAAVPPVLSVPQSHDALHDVHIIGIVGENAPGVRVRHEVGVKVYTLLAGSHSVILCVYIIRPALERLHPVSVLRQRAEQSHGKCRFAASGVGRGDSESTHPSFT